MTGRTVRDVRAPIDVRTLASLPECAWVQWGQPLPAEDVRAVMQWLLTHPQAGLRLYGAASTQLALLAAKGLPARIELDGSQVPDRLPALDGVCDLGLDRAPPNPARLLQALPNLRTLRAILRGAAFDARLLCQVPKLERLSLTSVRLGEAAALSTLSALRVVELCNAEIAGAAEILRQPALRALRLRDVRGVRSIEALSGHPELRVLALEGLTDLDSLQALATMPRLQSLHLTGLWQIGVREAEFIADLPALRRLRIDIGGRRKNVEISKRRNLPPPPPFDVRDPAF